MKENLAKVKWNPDQDVVRPADKPLSPTGGVVGLQGLARPRRRHRQGGRHEGTEIPRPGPLLRLRGGCLRRGQRQALPGRRRAGHPLRGAAKAAPACARCCRPPRRFTARAWATRWRSSPTAASRARRAASASAMSGPKRRSAVRSALIRDGDMIVLDAEKGTLDVELDAAELKKRAKAWKARPTPFKSGYLVEIRERGGAGADRCRDPSRR